MSYEYQHVNREKKEAQQLKQKALEPCKMHCRILGKEVTVLKEYPDYKGHWDKGEPGDIYCENIIECYQNEVKCKYSGISQLYPDPFSEETEPKID
ncbi:MAG: hypothetical protein ABIH00_05195 [Armatimonadota bacterium]